MFLLTLLAANVAVSTTDASSQRGNNIVATGVATPQTSQSATVSAPTTPATSSATLAGQSPVSTPPTVFSPDQLSEQQVLTRVKAAAAAIVASEFTVAPKEVLAFVNPVGAFQFACKNNMDLLHVVREVFIRGSTIEVNLADLASEFSIDVNILVGMTNWYDLYEYSKEKKEPLMMVMRQYVRMQIDDKQRTKQNKPKSASLEGFENELDCLKKFRPVPDGRPFRKERKEEIQRNKKNKKLKELRGINE